MIKKTPKIQAIIFLLGFSATPTLAQWSYPGCADVTATMFTYTRIVPAAEIWEPSDLAISMNTAGAVDVYYTELDNNGNSGPRVRRLTSTGAFQTLATLPVWQGPYGRGQTDLEEGITGIVLDPNFATNNQLYIHWSPASASVYRISRFTLSGTTLGSEQIILDIPAQRVDCCHTGGGMAFDNNGDLWIAQGNNRSRWPSNAPPTQGINETYDYSSDEGGAANTNSLVGGIIRIHPTATGYTNVSGNFGAYFGTAGTVRPEVFTKGSRNAYKLAVDPVRRWVAWSDVGPDVGGTNEEFNLRTTPAFMGWPYFVGNNIIHSFSGGAENVSGPTNNSVFNTGMTTLPPATPAFYSESQGANTGVTFYQYNPAVVNPDKFPPHFDQKWFYTSYANSQVQVVTTNATGTAMTNRQRIFSNTGFFRPTAMKFGPDGNLYIVNYDGLFSSGGNHGIVRVDYTGAACTPTSIRPGQNQLNPNARFSDYSNGWVVNMGSGRPILVPEGMIGFALYDLMGKKVWEKKSLRPGTTFTLSPELPKGAFSYRWITALP